jgi:hypothetical protein
MKIPKYWQRASAEEIVDGKPFEVVGWGWSDSSPSEALEKAKARLQTVKERVRSKTPRDNYDYYADAVREDRLQSFDDEENPFAVITRNGYGAKVLNCARVMFVDIDLPPAGFFDRLFGRKDAPRKKALARVESWVDTHREAGFRIYDTPAGLRLIATHKTFEPASDETAEILTSLGSDALYRKLCKSQESFRARLTPKPWRIALHRSPVRFPSEQTRETLSAWVRKYEQKSVPFAACRFVKAVGKNAFHGEIDRVISIHDAECKALHATRLA